MLRPVEPDPPWLIEWFRVVRRLLEDRSKQRRLRENVETAGVDSAHLKYVLDELVQLRGLRRDLAQNPHPLVVLQVALVLRQDLPISLDRGNWTSELVGDGGDEVRFRLVELFELAHRREFAVVQTRVFQRDGYVSGKCFDDVPLSLRE